MVAPMMQVPQQPPWLMQQQTAPQSPYMQAWQQQAAPTATPDLWQGVVTRATPAWQAPNQQSAYPQSTGPWQQASGTPEWAPPMSLARTATPDPSGNLPGTPGYTPPVVQPPKPATPQVVQPDGSAGHAETAGATNNAAGKPAWSQWTAGFDGSSYGTLVGKFDPWGNWGANGPAQNGAKKHQTAQGMESDLDRVYRWTNDIIRNQYKVSGGEAVDPLLRTQIFLANVERLRQEYKNAGVDWNTSDFANMDRQAAANGGAPPGTTPPGTTPPGTTPPATTPPAAGNVGGTGQPALRSFGQFQTDDMAALLQAAANDPDRAAQILRLARGQTGRPLGRMADFRDSLYGRSFQTALSLAGADGFQGLEGMAGDFLNNAVMGNNLMGYGSELGRRVAGSNFEGVDSATMEKMLRAGLAMQGINMGSLGGAVQSGRLEDLIYSDWARNLASSSNDTRNFSDLLQGSAFQRAMSNFR